MPVAIESILNGIDAEIARLQEVKRLLSGAEGKSGAKSASKGVKERSKR